MWNTNTTIIALPQHTRIKGWLGYSVHHFVFLLEPHTGKLFFWLVGVFPERVFFFVVVLCTNILARVHKPWTCFVNSRWHITVWIVIGRKLARRRRVRGEWGSVLKCATADVYFSTNKRGRAEKNCSGAPPAICRSARQRFSHPTRSHPAPTVVATSI